jgi:hypothetical protein
MQNYDHNIGFWEKRQFFAENCQESQKIVIKTSTPFKVVRKIEWEKFLSFHYIHPYIYVHLYGGIYALSWHC